MKSYLGPKDIAKISSLSLRTAYRVIDELREKPTKDGTPFRDTYEAKMLRKKVIPTEIFLRYFHHAKASIKAL